MYYSYIEIEYVATSFSPTRTDLAVKLLTALIYSKANRKRDIAVQKNYLSKEVEQQQDRILAARIDR
jgi:hypothetical protein